MIKNLRIIFKPKEKTIENLDKVLEVLGDESWDDKYMYNTLFNYNYIGIRYVAGAGEYTYLTADSVDGTELSLTDFFNKYDKEAPTHEDTIAEGIPKKHIEQVCSGKWNGYYIEASQEAYDLLIAEGYNDAKTDSSLACGIKNNGFFIIKEEHKVTWSHSDIRRFKKLKPLYIVDGKLSATQYHPDEVSFSASDAFCRKEVCDSDDLAMGEDKRYIERENLIVRVSSIFGIHYHNGSANFRMQNGYINNLQMSKKEFLELKQEFKRKSN